MSLEKRIPMALDQIHEGRKGILSFIQRAMGATSWRTIIRWKRLGLPVRHFPNGKPYIIESEVYRFALYYDIEKRKMSPFKNK